MPDVDIRVPRGLEVRIGPFQFLFLPDGDDPGTGSVLLNTESCYRAVTAFGVTRDEWDAFFAEAERT